MILLSPCYFSALKNLCTKLKPENRTQNWLQNSGPDFTAEELWPLNVPSGLSHMWKCYRSITVTVQNWRWSPNSRKCCKWQSNLSPINKVVRILKATKYTLCCSQVQIFLLFTETIMLFRFTILAWTTSFWGVVAWKFLSTRWRQCSVDNFRML